MKAERRKKPSPACGRAGPMMKAERQKKPSPACGRGLGEGAGHQHHASRQLTRTAELQEKPSPACGRGLGEGAGHQHHASRQLTQSIVQAVAPGTRPEQDR